MIGLGDRIEQALTSVGLTKEKVEAWLGSPCGCDARQAKLNAVGWWSERVLMRSRHKAVEYLEQLTGLELNKEPKQ